MDSIKNTKNRIQSITFTNLSSDIPNSLSSNGSSTKQKFQMSYNYFIVGAPSPLIKGGGYQIFC